MGAINTSPLELVKSRAESLNRFVCREITYFAFEDRRTGQAYIFIYDDNNECEAIGALWRFATNPELFSHCLWEFAEYISAEFFAERDNTA